METLIIYEAGGRSEDGRYVKFIESPKREDVEECIEIMKKTQPHGTTIVFLEKTFHLVNTTPFIIGE